MKRKFAILIFVLLTYTALGQADSTIIGKYTSVQEKGIHGVPGSWVGNKHVTSYISHVDTIITNSLLLENNHGAFLTIDTAVNLLSVYRPEIEQKLQGKWEIISEKPTPTIENMVSPIRLKFRIEYADNRLYELLVQKDDGFITYTKEHLPIDRLK